MLKVKMLYNIFLESCTKLFPSSGLMRWESERFSCRLRTVPIGNFNLSLGCFATNDYFFYTARFEGPGNGCGGYGMVRLSGITFVIRNCGAMMNYACA